MLSCEQFERDYIIWKEGKAAPDIDGEMRLHVANCAYCAKYNINLSSIRNSLSRQPIFEPSPEFDTTLCNRIVGIRIHRAVRDLTPERKAPNWAALGAGLATGLAIGIIAILPRSANHLEITNTALIDTTPPGAPLVAEVIPVEQKEPSLDSVRMHVNDSVKVETPPYDAGRHSRVVSGSGR